MQLDILVENMGRINFGEYLLQNTKGITKIATLSGQKLMGWKIYSLPSEKTPVVPVGFNSAPVAGSALVLCAATFTVAMPQETYLVMQQ